MADEKIFKKDNLELKIIYTGENFIVGYDGDEDDEDNERPIWAPEIKQMMVVFPNKKEVDISDMLPRNARLLGPCEIAFGYDNYEGNIIFKDVDKDGSLLEILHEIGHARVNRRYEENAYAIRGEEDIDNVIENESKRERHAWGWALLKLKELRREGLDLEPNMGREEIKKFIKDSLLSHEAMNRVKYFLHSDSDFKKEKPLKFFKSVNKDYLEKYIDGIYNNPEFNISKFVEKEDLKRSFGIMPKIK